MPFSLLSTLSRYLSPYIYLGTAGQVPPIGVLVIPAYGSAGYLSHEERGCS